MSKLTVLLMIAVSLVVAGCVNYEHLSSGLNTSTDGDVSASSDISTIDVDGGAPSSDFAGVVVVAADLAQTYPDGGGPCSGDPIVVHDNGMGQQYFDCVPVSTYNITQALEACNAYNNATIAPCDTAHSCGTGQGFLCGTYQGTTVAWYYEGARVGKLLISICDCAALSSLSTSPFVKDWN